MFCIKSFIFCVFCLTLCQVEAEIVEKDQTQEMSTVSVAPTPIVLKLSESSQSVENKIFQPKVEKDTNVVGGAKYYNRISNDIEVFKHTLGPQKEKQEEGPEVEAEGEDKVLTETEGSKETEAEPAADEEGKSEPEEEVDAVPKSEDEPAPETETESVAEATAELEEPEEQEIQAEPEAEQEVEKEPESEPEPQPEPETDIVETGHVQPEIQSEQKPESDVAPNKETEESEMPNDEPVKEEENDKQNDVASVTKDMDKNEISCFTCTSSEDSKCSVKATKQEPCPKVNEGDKGKHNGCYTLYQVDTNITMRGCVADLTEEGLKHCLTHEKLCDLCYSNNCNSKVAPSNAAKLQLNFYSLLFFTIFSIIIKKFTLFSYI